VPVISSGTSTNFYGTTVISGNSSTGNIFRVTKGGTVTVLADAYAGAGWEPQGPLTRGRDGNFYGCRDDVAFKLSPTGRVKVLHTFSRPNGSNAIAGLIEGPDGNFYGSTYEGGANDPDPANPKPGGTIFRLSPTGILTTLISLGTATGAGPNSALTVGNDGCFYGTTSYGGTTNGGTVFRLTVFPPQIYGVFPGTNVNGAAQAVIAGRFFSGTTSITSNGVEATSFRIDSPTQLTETLPTAASSNDSLSITTPLGNVSFDPSTVSSIPLLNLSSRGAVGVGEDVLIGGFILQGNAAKKVIIRALGPSLAGAGVAEALQDPVLTLYNGTGDIVATNDNWQNSPNKQAIIDSGLAPRNSHESAIVRILAPGNYTAIVRGVKSTTGIGLLEVYDLAHATGELANLSARARVEPGNKVLIGGFIIAANSPGKVLVRALGPSFATHASIANPLHDPQLDLREPKAT